MGASVYHLMKNCGLQGPQWLEKSECYFHLKNSKKEPAKCRLHLNPWSGNMSSWNSFPSKKEIKLITVDLPGQILLDPAACFLSEEKTRYVAERRMG